MNPPATNQSATMNKTNKMGNEAGMPHRVMSAEEIASLTVLCVTMVMAIAGNLRLIVYIRQTWRMVGRIMRINFFLINLAVGDICVGAVVCSGELLFIVFGQWELGPAMCKLTVYVQFVCLASTAFLLLAMTVDRYEGRKPIWWHPSNPSYSYYNS